MRTSIIAVVGFVFLAVMFSAIFYIQLALITIGVLVSFPIILGFLWGGHHTRRFWISGNARPQPEDPSGSHKPVSVQIEGRRFLLASVPPRLDFVVSCRNLQVLGAVAFVAVGAVSIPLVSGFALERLELDSPRFLMFYCLCFLIGLLIIPGWIWLTESSLIRTPGITLAEVHARSRGGLGTKWISYGFTDPQGGHHGGSGMDFGGPEGDHLKVVLCNPLNPGLNKLSCRLLFHRATWAEEDV
jgi:hypothetical protein